MISIIENFFIELQSFVVLTSTSYAKNLNYNGSLESQLYIRLFMSVYNVCAFIIFLTFIINIVFDLFFKKVKYISNIVKYFNIFSINIILLILFYKIYITLKLETSSGISFYTLKKEFFTLNNNLGILEHFVVITSSFSDSVLILSILVGIVCIDLLGSKNLLTSLSNLSIFYFFNFFILLMVTTNNLLLMFISFEFIFLPTAYFAYTTGYSKKTDIASKALIYWTFFGSFLVLCNLGYLYYKFNTLNWLFLTDKYYSKNETFFLYLNFLVGFGIKIPLAPFHYWLLKVHVESPTAFSIYLSGFLVKSALYCIYMFLLIFNNNDYYLSLSIWVMYGLIVSTVGLSRQVDIKKLIAWATVQEMTFMVFFLTLKQFFLLHTCIIFVMLHSLMSTYMFYIVDILQRRFKTRSYFYITGLNLYFPGISRYIWYLVLLFSGFPLTVKFFLEWNVILMLLSTKKFILLILLMSLNFIGIIYFCKIMFSILYGSSNLLSEEIEIQDINKKEKIILNTTLLYILLLFLLVFAI